MKFIIFVFFGTIIMFFVWNILKRMFFKKFYQFPFNNPDDSFNKAKKEQPKVNQNVKWDAETVEYEEVKEDKN